MTREQLQEIGNAILLSAEASNSAYSALSSPATEKDIVSLLNIVALELNAINRAMLAIAETLYFREGDEEDGGSQECLVDRV